MVMSSAQILHFLLYLAIDKDYFRAQTTQLSDHLCSNANVDVTFTLSTSRHSAYDLSSNCSLQKCNVFYSISGTCHSSSTPYFAYLLVDNNNTYYTPGILCSELSNKLPRCMFVIQRKSAELYDPSTGVWTPVENMVYARRSHGTFVLSNGELLMSGGRGDSESMLNSAELCYLD
ncbi:unnamed protein product [Adineta ricciae]|uniref:Uncharacterized protein n=1 Tax=Adineta ricciae TaxID=249248 RepID=A0A816C2C8_ADIRI|nr:unnamed protein product [Adineta ricciae]